MSAAIKMARAGYQGDPGLFGFIKGVAKAGFALATGGPTAAGASIVRSIRGRTPPPMIPSRVGATTPPQFFPTIPPQNGQVCGQIPRPGVGAAVERFLPGGETGMMPGAAPGGFHWNKTAYYTQSEGWIEKGTKLVKNRRRNPGNIKAASRSLSRVIATKKALSTFSKVTVRDPNAPVTKTVYKCTKCRKTTCVC